jgi:hypothetical protein
MRQPISETEMKVFLDEQIARIDDLTRPVWKKHRVKMESAQGAEGSDSPIFIVARSGTEVVFYDDRSQEFGTGEVDESGALRPRTMYGEELRFALRHFPRVR